MRFQEQAVKLTQHALDDICRAARAIPTDKVDWVPMGMARSVLDQMQEIAITGTYLLPILRGDPPKPFDFEERQRATALRRKFGTIELCIEESMRTLAELCQAISAVEDEILENEIMIPFAGEGMMTMADVVMIGYWNMVYHLGQINQIQLMLGDTVMH